MKIRSFRFNLLEFSGSMGDFGTLFPLVIGYIVVCKLNPASVFIMMGLANIAMGFIYKIPIPVQPMKMIAITAIAQQWSPSLICASGIAMGIIWLFFGITGIVDQIAKYTPNSVIRGIQVAIGTLLAIRAFNMLSDWWLIGIASIIIALLLRRNRFAPSSIVLIAVGIVIVIIKGQIQPLNFSSPNFLTFTTFNLEDIGQALLLAGFAQIPLTATNAVISTSKLINTYWPDKHIKEKKLSFSMGIMNLLLPLFGGIPVCHGAGGLAGQYYFGARTGGAKIIEGLIEISIGLFFAVSIIEIFDSFPIAIIGAMMFLVGVELAKFAKDVRSREDLVPMLATIIVSLVTNLTYGFAVGFAAHYLIQYALKRQLYKTVSG